jgi:hypothetical protein
MRPNVDIPWSLHGQVKEWAEETNRALTEAYIELVKTGLDNVEHPDNSAWSAMKWCRSDPPLKGWASARYRSASRHLMIPPTGVSLVSPGGVRVMCEAVAVNKTTLPSTPHQFIRTNQT